MTMKCPNCGSENTEYAFYCGSCATQLREHLENRNLGNALPERFPRRGIDWIPLLIVIAAVFLAELAQYGYVGYPYYGGSSLETQAYVVLGFLASIAFFATIALVIYRREDLSKTSLIIGMALLVVMLAVKASVYLR